MIENKIKGVIFGIGRHWKAIKSYIKKDFEIKAYIDNFKIGGGGISSEQMGRIRL